jgi:thioredoxin reductase (NADPH)
MSSNKKIAIIGSGPSGLTAGIYASRANLDVTVFMGVQPGGQLTTTIEIENFPGFPEGILGLDLMLNMQKQAERFGAKTLQTEVKSLEIVATDKGRVFKLSFDSKDEVFDAVIIASGASARYLGLEGEDKYIGKGYHSCATCDGFFYRGKTIAVVGGGDSAMQEANFLTRFADKVYLIHRRDEFRASKIMQDRAMKNPKIEPILNTIIYQFIGQERVEGVVLENTKTGEKKEMKLDGVFVAIGHIPNTGFVKNVLSMDEMGYLQPVKRTMSEIEGIFIAGDVEDKVYRQAITAAGDGCRAAMDCEKWLESLE